jgi:hypothetical protein
MKCRSLAVCACAVLSISTTMIAQDATDPVRVFMPDGQLLSHNVRIYINRDISRESNPRLKLLEDHAITPEAVDKAKAWEPALVASGQRWTERGADTPERSGTILIVDLRGKDIPWYKAMMRVTPVITWTDEGGAHTASADHEVNLGNIVAAIAWTLVIVIGAVGVILVLAKGGAVRFLTGADGHLSLSQTQIACWTVLVGATVLGYGLIRLEVPTIPSSLVVLMGASLATGGVGFFRDSKRLDQAAPMVGANPTTPAWSDLVRVYAPGRDGDGEPSLAKAQMIVWTIILSVLFVSKSLLDGTICDIPWPLVALMGFSQAGYLVPKFSDAQIPDQPAASAGTHAAAALPANAIADTPPAPASANASV